MQAVEDGGAGSDRAVRFDLVEKLRHHGREDAAGGGDGHPLDTPNLGQTQQEDKAANDKSDAGILRQQDVLKVIGFECGSTALLHAHKGVNAVFLQDYSEVVLRRWRGYCPFQGAALPGIARDIGESLAVADAHHELNERTSDPHHDQCRACSGGDQLRLLLRIAVVLHASRHAHQAMNTTALNAIGLS